MLHMQYFRRSSVTFKGTAEQLIRGWRM